MCFLNQEIIFGFISKISKNRETAKPKVKQHESSSASKQIKTSFQ